MQIPLFFPKQVTPLFKHTIHLFLLFFFYNIISMKPWIVRITKAHCLIQSFNCKVCPVKS